MASEKAGDPRPFDVKTVEYLIGLMAEHELTEIALKEGDKQIRLSKSGPPTVTQPMPLATPIAQPAPPTASPAGPNSTAKPVSDKAYHEIKSEMVGTFYSRPKPDKDDFVKPGSSVRPDSTICLIEAMKIFNEIKAETAGTVVEVCVKNGDPVDFGTVLFRIDTNS